MRGNQIDLKTNVYKLKLTINLKFIPMKVSDTGATKPYLQHTYLVICSDIVSLY